MATDEEDFVSLSETNAADLIEAKILSTLSIYPKLSYSMLQVGIGTAIPPKLWHPILNKLKKEDRVVEESLNARSPMQRDLTHRILMLKEHATPETK